jgi:hypothetical protein
MYCIWVPNPIPLILVPQRSSSPSVARPDDVFWIGEIGWSSPRANALHTDMRSCDNFSCRGHGDDGDPMIQVGCWTGCVVFWNPKTKIRIFSYTSEYYFMICYVCNCIWWVNSEAPDDLDRGCDCISGVFLANAMLDSLKDVLKALDIDSWPQYFLDLTQLPRKNGVLFLGDFWGSWISNMFDKTTRSLATFEKFYNGFLQWAPRWHLRLSM